MVVGKVVEWDSTRSLLYFQQERFGDFGTNNTTGDDHSVFEGLMLLQVEHHLIQH